MCICEICLLDHSLSKKIPGVRHETETLGVCDGYRIEYEGGGRTEINYFVNIRAVPLPLKLSAKREGEGGEGERECEGWVEVRVTRRLCKAWQCLAIRAADEPGARTR